MSGPQTNFSRYVALGDSQTEGWATSDDATGLRGWADRFAERLAAEPGLQYASLAVRGRLAGQVRAEQLAPALALKPDLASVVARGQRSAAAAVRRGRGGRRAGGDVRRAHRRGHHVITLTFRVTRIMPLARPLGGRITLLNARIREAAGRHGVTVAEMNHHAVATDPRLWSETGCTPAHWDTHASPPPWRTPSECRAATTPGPGPSRPRTVPARPALGRTGRAPLGQGASSARGSSGGCGAGRPATDAPRSARNSPWSRSSRTVWVAGRPECVRRCGGRRR